jgi:hypothetical protein
MNALICLVLAVLASLFRSNSRLEAGNAVLRHQLIVLRRTLKGPARLTINDRWFFVHLYRSFPSILPVPTRNAGALAAGWLSTRASMSEMADLSAKPDAGHRSHGFVPSADHWL